MTDPFRGNFYYTDTSNKGLWVDINSSSDSPDSTDVSITGANNSDYDHSVEGRDVEVLGNILKVSKGDLPVDLELFRSDLLQTRIPGQQGLSNKANYSIPNYEKAINIQTSYQRDWVDVAGVSGGLSKLDIDTNAGSDIVTINDTNKTAKPNGWTSVDTGSGDDLLIVNHSNSKLLTINTGDGSDIAMIDLDNIADTTSIEMGSSGERPDQLKLSGTGQITLGGSKENAPIDLVYSNKEDKSQYSLTLPQFEGILDLVLSPEIITEAQKNGFINLDSFSSETGKKTYEIPVIRIKH